MKTKPAVRFALIYGFLVVVALGYFWLPSRKADGRSLSITTPRPTNKHTTTEITTVEPVVNPHLFKFTIHNQAACFNRSNSNGELFLVFLVKCAPFEKLDRQQIRKTWGGVKEVLGRRVLTMFLLGESTDPIIRKKIQEEDNTFHDLIQVDFIDAYTNLTYKNMMGLKWVSMYCPQTSFVVSVDADMMINIVTLVKRLSTMPKTNFAEGHLQTDIPVIRAKTSKWYMPKEEFAENVYPPYLRGVCYSMSRDAAVRTFEISKYVPFLFIDDVFVGICLTKAGVILRYSQLYEQNKSMNDPMKKGGIGVKAMNKGIGVGILHNKDHLNQPALKLWYNIVGSQIADM
ncbi:beta-1,3-galactosyltransferase 5-like [Asterias rubens]|uniref:beta-1,3-galactosyltransferase 5-like n=1 Tax=Asterias rubens TaxID=7604 RepID=UPI0014556CC0|nr:beta-1,3-galactosyltransferase 5-like [Asterias rubens]